MKPPFRAGLVTIAALSTTSACVTAQMQRNAATVHVLRPIPLIDLPVSDAGIRLEIDPAVPDQFLVPEQDGITAVPVEGWHQSLLNGFGNGIARYFLGSADDPAA